uniref:Transmembrane protein n=2 Tax=Hordeum vulgare subsp. vulgare TaxID=112509 RepID=A0A8I6XPD5_HORVV
MADWAPVFVGLVLFVLLSPGLLFQIPSKGRIVEFGSFQTSGVSIIIHAVIYFALITILLLAVRVQVFLG